MAGFGAASLPLISAIALLAGALLIILGFAAPYWANDGTHYVGLWRYGRCVKDDIIGCYALDQPSFRRIPDWLHAVRALECVAVACVSIPLVILPVYMYVALGMYYRCMMGTMCLFALMSTLTGIAGVIVYGINLTNNGWDIAWSMICVIIGSAIVFIGFLILLISMVSKRPSTIHQPFYPSTIYVDPYKNKLYTIRLED
ncbi:uncharacterized protein LOC127870458 [Dreissena polymorpha]|uniref:Uncharacterized protein n=1 Tax=Dreissena polymorpha TaxID=45954 RepID=A0A9D4MEM7_DREPO|nr:uncharacterized protein LOC127870458 [Dreissena polymorpha]KAH3874765.1 hypothetical protein DPMN_038018 [Dreissena polymorpha]